MLVTSWPGAAAQGKIMKRAIGLLLILAATAVVTAQQPLQIYVIDPEGGKAALWISPSGETVLIDSGNPGAGT